MKLRNPAQPQQLKEIIDFLQDVKVEGELPESISNAAGLDSSNLDSNYLSFVRHAEAAKVLQTIEASKASVFLISDKTPAFSIPEGKSVLKVRDPNLCFVKILEKFFIDHESEFLPSDIDPTAVISKSATIDPSVKIGAYAVIGDNVSIAADCIIHPHVIVYHDVKIAENVTIHANTVIREHTVIGRNCQIQPGCTIGSDGFGYVPDPSSGLRAVPQIGIVVIEDNVEIGANSCIDRATAGQTVIGKGTKIDNLVQIGHNVQVGQNTLLCGQVGIGGSSKIGSGVVLAGKVGVVDHVAVASGARVGGGSIVTQTLDKAGDYSGNPAMPAFSRRRILIAERRLPDLIKKFLKD